MNKYESEEFKDGKGRQRNGSPLFYQLLDRMAQVHDMKSHDYVSNSDPFGNYHFAGMMSKLFNNPDDSGFVSRIGEKLFRLANLENSNKEVKNESIEDTEVDICVITLLWMADRKARRMKQQNQERANQAEVMENMGELARLTIDNDFPVSKTRNVR